jgi:hypothetical protein
MEPRTPSSGEQRYNRFPFVFSPPDECVWRHVICASATADEGVRRSTDSVSQFRAWQEWVVRVSLCTLGTFHSGGKRIEFKLLRESFRGLLKPFLQEYHLNLSELHSRRHNESADASRAHS